MNELLNGIPWGAIAPILVIHLILMITALVSCIREEKTNGPKWLWILIILIINLIGPGKKILLFTGLIQPFCKNG